MTNPRIARLLAPAVLLLAASCGRNHLGVPDTVDGGFVADGGGAMGGKGGSGR